jgi:hypothetical protein
MNKILCFLNWFATYSAYLSVLPAVSALQKVWFNAKLVIVDPKNRLEYLYIKGALATNRFDFISLLQSIRLNIDSVDICLYTRRE